VAPDDDDDNDDDDLGGVDRVAVRGACIQENARRGSYVGNSTYTPIKKKNANKKN